MREIRRDILRFPKQRRMQPNPFHNLEMLRKKKLGLIFPGSDGNEIGFLTGVVQNALQKRSCGREHLGRFGSVIGLEQRVEKPAEFFLVHCGNPFDCVGSEITIHGAAEEHGKLAKNLGIMRETGLRKAEEVVQVAGVAAVDHGFDLSAKDFLGGEDEKLARRRADGGRGREHLRRESASAHQEINLHLNAFLGAGMIDIA